MLLARLLRLDEAEHLDLVELVHPEDALRVLAGGARLAPEAGGEPGVAARQLARAEDLARVQRGERHLRGAGQEQLVLGHAVDLLLGVGQHAGAEQSLLAHQHRRHDRGEALPLQQVERPLDERELEPHQRALEVDEARAGHPRALLQAEVLAQQLHVAAAGRSRLALLAQHLVLGRGGRVGRGSAARPARRRAAPRPRAAPPRAPSPARRTALTSAIASVASAPVRCSSPMRLEASFLRRLSSSSSGSSARRRSSSSSASSSSATSKPRLRRPSRAGSGSSRISLRSSTRPRRPASRPCPSTSTGSRPPPRRRRRRPRWRA